MIEITSNARARDAYRAGRHARSQAVSAFFTWLTKGNAVH